MKTIWKWIIGVAILLVVLAGFGFAARGMFVSHTARFAGVDDFGYEMPDKFDRDDRQSQGFGQDRFHGPGGGYDHHMPMYGGRGHGGHGFGGYGYLPLPFLFLGGFLKQLIPLGVLALVTYIAYQQGKKIGAAEALLSAPPSQPVAVPKSRPRKAVNNE